MDKRTHALDESREVRLIVAGVQRNWRDHACKERMWLLIEEHAIARGIP